MVFRKKPRFSTILIQLLIMLFSFYKWANLKNCTKRKTSLPFWCILFLPQNKYQKGWCLMGNSIYHSTVLYNTLKQFNLCRLFSHTYIKHMMAIILSVYCMGFKGKTVDFLKVYTWKNSIPFQLDEISGFLRKIS